MKIFTPSLKAVLLSNFFLLVSNSVFSQCEYWEVNSFNSYSQTKPVVDPSGNVYTLVAFIDSTNVNGQIYLTEGGTGTGHYIAKHAPDGSYLWTSQIIGRFNFVFGGIDYNTVNDKLYISSTYETVDFGLGVGLETSTSTGDPFIVQIDPTTGTIEWGNTYAIQGSFGWFTGLDHDSEGNMYVSARLNGPMAYINALAQPDTVAVDMVGGSVSMLMKFAPDGTYIWDRISNRLTSVGNQNSRAGAVKVSLTDEIAIGGYFTDSLSFGGSFAIGPGAGSLNIYAATFDKDGNNLLIMGDVEPNSNFEAVYAVDWDDNGGVYLVGSLSEGNHNFDVVSALYNYSASTFITGNNGFTMKIKPQSYRIDFGFIRKPGGSSQWVSGIATDFTNRIVRVVGQVAGATTTPTEYNTSLYVGNTFESTDSVFRTFVAEYNMDNNQLISIRALPDEGNTTYGMAATADKIYITGTELGASYLTSSPLDKTEFRIFSGNVKYQPTSEPVGTPITLAAVTVSPGATIYQWYRDNVLLGGETGNSLTISDDVSGDYFAEVTNSDGCTLRGTPNNVSFFTPSLAQDSTALVSLYNATNGLGWVNSTNWTVGTIDTWFGVTVNLGRVTKLVLDNNNLNGTLPANDIRTLTELTKIEISSNAIFGDLNDAIYTLINLDTLNIGDTNWEGEFPSSLQNLSNLSFVNLYSPIGGFGGHVDSTFLDLPNLSTFEVLGNGSLSIEFPQNSVKNNYSVINMQNVNYGNLFPSFIEQQSGIAYLRLNGMNITGDLPILNYPSLTDLIIDDDSLTSIDNILASTLSNIVNINFGGNKIMNVPDLSSFGTIQSFEIMGNLLDFEDVETLVGYGFTTLDYANQQSIVGYDSIVAETGSIDLDATMGGSDNTYEWFKDGTTTGVTTPIYNIFPMLDPDVGIYHAVVNSNVIGDLTIQTQNFNIQIASLPQNYYWIGDGGNWADLSHWASTSGGAADRAFGPDKNDSVFFDVNSFSSVGQIVVVTDNGDSQGIEFGDLDWTGVTNTPTFEIKAVTSSWLANTTEGSSLTFSPDMIIDFNAAEFYFEGSNDISIDTKGHNLGATSYWSFGDGASKVTDQTNINLVSDLNSVWLYVKKGKFNTNGFDLLVEKNGYFWIRGDSATVDISNSYVEAGQFFKTRTSSTFIDTNAVIKVFDKINGENVNFNHLIVADTVEFQNHSYQADTLEILAGAVVTLNASDTLSVNEMYAAGTAANPIIIQSSLAASTATILKLGGEVSVGFVSLKDNIATGGATFNAYASTNLGNTSGWNFLNNSVQDSLALVVLYDSTSGAGWWNNSNWLSGALNTWYGLTVTGGAVTSINLSGNNLIGTLPAEIGNLTSLTNLSAGYNTISGSLPPEIGQLSNLDTLFMSYNAVDGTIPIELYNLTNLVRWSMSNNQLNGLLAPEIANLTNLKYLALWNNPIGGAIPVEFWDMSQLENIFLGTSNISGEISPNIGSFTNLREFWISDCNISGFIPAEIGNLASLEVFNVSNTQMTGVVPASITNLSNLTSLRLDGNGFTDLPNLTGLDSLTEVGVNYNYFEFDDIEPNIGVTNIFYEPQKPIPGPGIIGLKEGEAFDLSFTVGGSANSYQWVKDSVNIAGATTDSYSIGAIVPTDAGNYYLQITNPLVPTLILSSELTLLDLITDFYWVGNGGNWADLNHWASFSGGVGNKTEIPGKNDLVYFDVNSFTSAGQIVVVSDNGDQQGTEFGIMDWRGVSNFPTFQIRAVTSNWLESYTHGSLYFSQDMTLDFHHAEFYFGSGDDYVLDTKGHYMGEDSFLDFGYGFGDSQTTNSTRCDIISDLNNVLVYLNVGQLHSNGNTIKGQKDQANHYIWMAGDSVLMDVSNSYVEFGQFNKAAESSTLIASNTKFKAYTEVRGENIHFENLVVSDSVEFRFFDYQIDTLEILPGAVLTLEDSTTLTVNTLKAVGTVSSPITIQSSVLGTASNISQSSGVADAFNLNLIDNNAVGGAIFNVYRSTDGGGNTGWNFLSASVADSIALTAFYDEATGADWTDNTNWTTGPVNTWFGIGIKGANVSSIALPANNLVGNVAPELATITTLERLDLQDNFLVTIPDLTELPTLDTLNVANNNLDFASLETNATIIEVDYTNQGEIGLPIDTVIYVGGNYKLVAETAGDSNTYQWKKIIGINVVDTINLEGKTTNTLYLDSLNRQSMGTFICEVNNTVVTDLTLLTSSNRILAGADITGLVKDTNGLVLDSGIVNLFQVQIDAAFDTTAVFHLIPGDGGVFNFPKAVLADYIFLANIDTISFPETLPTYWTSTIFWEEADTLKLNTNEPNIEILVSATPPDDPGGEGEIFGVVFEDLPETGRLAKKRGLPKASVSVRRKRGASKGDETLEDIFDLIGYVTTDDDGNYSIGRLQAGIYRFNVQYPGIPMDTINSNVDIEVTDEGAGQKTQVIATVTADGIILESTALGIDRPYIEKRATAYPVPSSSILYIKLDSYRDMDVVLTVKSITGQTISTEQRMISADDPSPIELDIHQLETGIYIVEIQSKQSFRNGTLKWRSRFMKTEN